MANYDPVQITLNDSPRSVVRAMDNLVVQRQQVQRSSVQRGTVLRLLFFLGLGLIVLDLIAGYASHVFLIAGALMLPVWFVTWLGVRSRSLRGEFPPRYKLAREIIYTLRDDMYPGRPLYGQIDLTGWEQPAKVAREGKNALGRTIRLYCDEWLTFKAKLYDGNMLRFSAVERRKMREGFWKRGRSRMKFKPSQLKGLGQQVKVRLAVNPEAYTIVEPAQPVFQAKLGPWHIGQVDCSGGIITLCSSVVAAEVEAADVLAILKLAYGYLQRKSDTQVAAGGNA